MTNRHEFEELDNHQISRLLLSRRRLLGLGSAGVAGIGLAAAGCGTQTGRGATQGGSASASTVALLTVEEMEGPYYLDYELFRRDVTEGKKGVPLALRLMVVDATTGGPLGNAAVEIWQCDAMGLYSGFTSTGSSSPGLPSGMPSDIPTGAFPSGMPSGMPGGGLASLGAHQNPTDKLTFLRGSQMSDSAGNVEFQTIFPGWYSGRAIHIHTKVHVDGKHTSTGYEGGHVCHTGQLFFAEETVAEVKDLSTYAANKTARTTLDTDNIYRASGGGAKAGLLNLELRDKQNVEEGIIGSLTLGVDPSKTNTGEGSSTSTGTKPGGQTSASPSS